MIHGVNPLDQTKIFNPHSKQPKGNLADQDPPPNPEAIIHVGEEENNSGTAPETSSQTFINLTSSSGKSAHSTFPIALTNRDQYIQGSQSKIGKCVFCLQVCPSDARKLSCGHSFCHGCVTPWLKTHSTCPLCRAIVLEGVEAGAPLSEVPQGNLGNWDLPDQNHVNIFTSNIEWENRILTDAQWHDQITRCRCYCRLAVAGVILVVVAVLTKIYMAYSH